MIAHDPIAIHHLARFLAGASDADLEAIRATWPDAPVDGGADRAVVRAWLEAHPDLAQAVLAIDPSTPPRAAPTKTSWTVRELLTTEFPEPRWAVPNLIPEGLTLFCGRPKLGKSWFALQLACAVGAGGRLLDQQVPRGKVLVLALEDSPRRIRNRIRKQAWPVTDEEIRFETEWPDLAQDGGLAKLQDAIIEHGYTLVIVDTLSRAACYDQNDVVEATAVLGNLQQVAGEHRCTIFAVDHYRKPVGFVGDLIDDVLGSTGKAAAADAILGLVRERGKRGAILRVTGRDVEEHDLAIEWDVNTCCWQLLGDAQEVARTEGCREVLGALEALGGEATTKEIAEHLGKNKGSISRVLADLINEGKILRGRKKGKEVPYRLAGLPEEEEGNPDD